MLVRAPSDAPPPTACQSLVPLRRSDSPDTALPVWLTSPNPATPADAGAATPAAIRAATINRLIIIIVVPPRAFIHSKFDTVLKSGSSELEPARRDAATKIETATERFNSAMK